MDSTNPAGPPTPAPTRLSWWQTTAARLAFVGAAAVLMVVDEVLGVFAMLAALVLLWVRRKSVGHPWRVWQRGCASFGAFLLCTIVAGVAHPVPDEPRTSAKAGATATPAAAEDSTPRPAVKAPDYAGERLDRALKAAKRAGYETARHDASDRRRQIVAASGWTVCFQRTAKDGSVDLAAVKTAEPCPEHDGGPLPWPTMSDVPQKSWASARKALVARDIDRKSIRAEAAYSNDTLPKGGGHDRWTVCAQDPRAGARVQPHDTVTLKLTAPRNDCPSADVDYPKLPDRDHDGTPDYRDHHDDRPGASKGGSSGDSSSSGGGGGSSSNDSSDPRDTPPSNTGNGSPSGGSSSSGGSSNSSTGGSGGSVGTVHPGAFCSPPGATGRTTAGTAMVCGPAADNRNRWHAA